MKSLSLLVITLLTCTTQIFCAATSPSDSSLQSELQAFCTFDVVQRKSKIGQEVPQQPAWTTDPQLASMVAYHIGPYRSIVAYHEKVSYKFRKGLEGRIAENFGFGISVKERTPALCVSKTEFKQLDTSRQFEVRDTIYLDIGRVGGTTTIGYLKDFFLEGNPPRSLLLLTMDEIIPPAVTAALNMPSVAAAAQVLREYMPDLTFVLFDVTEYNSIKLRKQPLSRETKHKRRKSV